MSKKNKKVKPQAPAQPLNAFHWTDKTAWILIGLIHLVCPLLFFTNLTRNPYFTQIFLLNVGLAALGLLWAAQCFLKNEWTLPRTSFDKPLGVFLVLAALTSIVSWVDHPFVRPGLFNEGVRVWVFTLVNSVFALYAPLVFMKKSEESERPPSIWPDIVMAVLWSLCWYSFHSMKSRDASQSIWDPFGGFLWILAIVYGVFRAKTGNPHRLFHLIFAVSLVAGGYGLLQYMGRDWIWGSPIQPYGGRPVSTFGNPNFLSSYLMIVSLISLAYAFSSKGKNFWGYGLVFVFCAMSTLGTLTRSTYVGLFAGLLAFGVLIFRKEDLKRLKWVGVAVVALLGLLLLFPSTPVTGAHSPLSRFTEAYEAIKSGQAYGPWDQRLLIWSSAWDMLKERIFFGKGWGAFELFYPYYQGKFILSPRLAEFRTHANNAHNVLLEMWSQLGFLGTAAAIWFVVTFAWGGWKILQKKEGGAKLIAASFLAGFLAMFVDNFFGNVSIFFAVPAFLFWWVAGSLYNDANGIIRVRRPLHPVWGRSLLILFSLSCFFAMTYYFSRWKQEIHYFNGFKLAKQGKIQDSIKQLEKAHEWFPAEVNGNYELGNAYASQAKILDERGSPDRARPYREKAKWAYQESIHANPGYDEIFFNLGITHNQLGETEEAKKNLRVALYINPLLRDAYASLGNIYAKENRFDKTAEIFELALQTFPQDAEIWTNLGYAYGKQNLRKKALAAFESAYIINPTDPQAWGNLNLAAKDAGTTTPLTNVPQLIQRVESEIRQGRAESARVAAERLVNLLPDFPDARVSLGNALFYLNRLEEAEEEFKTALEQKPSLLAARFNLAEIYKRQNQPEKAGDQYRLILERDPQNVDAKNALASLQR